MADWQEIKQKAERITRRLRAVQPANILSDQENFNPLRDRIPRPGRVDLVGQLRFSADKLDSREKRGHEISGAQMEALKAGTMWIDARLDLHGMMQHQAYSELGRFIQKQVTRGARLLLIITGKGKDLHGVLRASLPGWLMAGEFKPHILTIHPAHPKHGGDGATYVLLRKTGNRN